MNPKREIIKHRPIGLIAETHVVEDDFAMKLRRRPSARQVADARRRFQHLQYAFAGCQRVHKFHANFGQVLDRFVKVIHICSEHNQIAGMQTSIENLHRAES